MGLEQGLLEQQASAGLLQANCHPVLQHQATRRFLTEQDDVTVVLMLTGSLLARQRSPPSPPRRPLLQFSLITAKTDINN